MKQILMFALALLAMTAAAIAQEVAQPETVTVPWGSWVAAGVDTLLPTLLTALTGVATYVVGAYVPPWLKMLAGDKAQQRVNQIITKAVNSALAQTKGAVSDKKLDITVANDVLRKAMQYAVDQAPKLISSAAKGSAENLMKMTMARMEEMGVVPAEYNLKEAEAAVEPEKLTPVADGKAKTGAGSKASTGKFEFEDAIKKGLGGG